MLTTAPRAVTAAAIARPTSSALILRAAETVPGRRAGAGAEAAAGRLTLEPVPVGGRAAGAGAAAVGGRGGGGAGAVGAEVLAPVGVAAGPPAGRVGNLMVGEDAGLGGKLIRTVSFFGWTLAASAGFGGTAPPGTVGLLSAIIVCLLAAN